MVRMLVNFSCTETHASPPNGCSVEKSSTNLVADFSNYNLVNYQSFIHLSSVDFTIFLVYWFLLFFIMIILQKT